MAETTLTVRQIMDLGLWQKVCDYKDWDHYILTEGKIDEDELVTFDSEFKKIEIITLTDEEMLMEINKRWEDSELNWNELRQDYLWLKDKCNELMKSQ